MRRGHTGIGAWRNENSRHFRPRGGGSPHFRPNRYYHMQDTPRFPSPTSRIPRGRPYNSRPLLLNTPIEHNTNKYRYDSRRGNHYRPQERTHQDQRQIFPFLDHKRLNRDQGKHYNDNKNYYDGNQSEQCHPNNLDIIDQRQLNIPIIEILNNNPSTSWGNNSENKRQYYDDKNNHNSSYRHPDNIEGNKIPVLDYSGHRPPSSDHYGSSSGSSLDNLNSFSRSIDDTVDIVRKRLQNRNEAPPPRELIADHCELDDQLPNHLANYQERPQPQPATKKRIQRQKQNASNCDKMKTKIVHELFKMDKDKIHKLMDNPRSSSKFEYALSTLITESQNSLNRHLRSVAEKSLCSSEDFVHNDNNTIYEDTFMKQMQGILDPQDTVLLEDIKPLVLAELSKVLQLDDYDQPFAVLEDQNMYPAVNEQSGYESYDTYNYENYTNEEYYEKSQTLQTPNEGYDYPDSINDNNTSLEYNDTPTTKPVFERSADSKSSENPEINFSTERNVITKSRRHSRTGSETNFIRDRFSNERRHSQRSLDQSIDDDNEEISQESEPQNPFFDSNTVQLSDDEDPFAELDKQYHVAVDENFIDYSISSPIQSTSVAAKLTSATKDTNKIIPISTTTRDTSIKEEIDYQILNIAKSPLKLILNDNKESKNITIKLHSAQIKQEVITTPEKDSTNRNDLSHVASTCATQEGIVDSKYENITLNRPENLNMSAKSILTPNSRKRSIDQKPSHRKEKRKKSSSSPNTYLNESTSHPVKNLPAKSNLNLLLSKNMSSNEVSDSTKVGSVDKSYSDKYVKRKESHKKSNETEGVYRKRQRSVSSSHSNASPKERDNLNSTTATNKSEHKNKLQTIDMFLEQPRKTTLHQAHRNTAPCPNTTVKTTPSENVKVKEPPVKANTKKVVTKHACVQASIKMHIKETQTLQSKSFSTRSCQTERKKSITRGSQTEPFTPQNTEIKATDAFERMKEIDLEIQVLLQEKFKLYNSLESNVSSYPMPSSTIQSLGMTVLNVAPIDEIDDKGNDTDNLSGDAIIESFTNIPVEELEQIALESSLNININKKEERRSRRQRIIENERASSSSPVTRGSKKNKAPNISLLEQIITDDRPLEDIISLDDFETAPPRTRKQKSHKLAVFEKIPKKKIHKKTKAVKSIASEIDFELKECSVVLIREDLYKYVKSKDRERSTEIESVEDEIEAEDPCAIELSEIVVETVVNDLQLDMLDVSEDIVVGDNCEIKTSEGKYIDKNEVTINEGIILDNSQCSELVQSEVAVGENLCRMYDYSTDENLRRDSITVTGHADAALAIECIENNFIAACLDGNVYYFSSDGQLITTLRGSNLAVTCLTIVKEKYGTTVYTGSLDSRIRYYDLETGLEKGPECNVLSPIQTMDRAWDTIFVGTRTGFVLQFECKNNMLIPVSTVKFSDQSILALRAMKEGPRKVLLVAARSEDVTIKDAQTGLLLRSLQGPKMTVYTLLYEDGKIYCGTSSHQIHVFDYASGTHAGTHEGGKGAVCLRATGGLVFAGCYDGCVYIYRESEPRPLAQLRGPSLMLLSLAVVGSKIIAGYKDRSLYIWKIPVSILNEMIL